MCVCVYVIRMCVYACMFGTKLLTKGILWSHYSIIKATPTTYIGGLRNVRLLPTPLPLYSLLYHTMIVSCLQDLPFHSPVHNSMYTGSYVMEDNKIGCSMATQSEPPPPASKL